MKYQILLITLLMGVALAFPVPDEEVSPGSSVAAAASPHIGEIKTDAAADKPALKTALADETKTKAQPSILLEKQQEAKKIEEDKKPKVENAKQEEKQPILAFSAPDSELPQNLPEPQKPATEIKEKEKNIRSENLATEELKSLPSGVFEAPVVAPSAVETQKQIVEEEKPVLQVILPEGKNAAASSAAATIATEEKESFEEKINSDAALPLSAVADAAPAPAAAAAPASADENIVASTTVDETKKVDSTGRQERWENEAKKESADIIAEVPAAAPAEAIKEDVSFLKAAEPLNAAEKSESLPAAAAAATEADFKPKIENIAEELKSVPVGDIEKQPQPLEEKETKIQEIIEKKESASIILPEGKEIETGVAKEPAAIKPDATINETVQPLTTSEPKDSSEEKKDSLESKESAESDESKAKSEENISN